MLTTTGAARFAASISPSVRSGARSKAATTSAGTRTVSLMSSRRSRARGPHLLEERLDARGMLERVVGTELEVRGDAQLEVLAQPVAHETPGAVQRRHRRLPLRVVAQDRDEDLGRAQVLRRLNLGHRHEAEPRVLELALQQHRNFFFDELVDAVEPFALHQRISTVVSRTMPSTWSSMKSIAFDTTSLAWRASFET